MKKKCMQLFSLVIAIICLLSGCGQKELTSQLSEEQTKRFQETVQKVAESLAEEKIQDTVIKSWNGKETIENYSGEAYATVNENIPYFTDKEKTTEVFENYSDLDNLGRCGIAYANICKELMPTEKRGEIGMIKPSGWHTVRYDELIKDKYLYNRCHLIGYQLAGENANEKNLITGTRYMNVDGMLPFENEVADYVHETGNHVLYRVTPIFYEDDLVCRGVEMEAFSVEDNGEGVTFHVFVHNIQPGISIDYKTGDSWASSDSKTTVVELEQSAEESSDSNSDTETTLYVLNTKTKKFHLPECESVEKISEKNKEEIETSRKNIIADGYTPCGICKP